MLLVSENLSDFPFCSHGVVAVDSQDNAEELLATDVRLMLITSAKFGHDSEKPQHFSIPLKGPGEVTFLLSGVEGTSCSSGSLSIPSLLTY